MTLAAHIKRSYFDLFTAVEFLTRIPVPARTYDSGSLARSVVFFPIVGLLVGGIASVLNSALLGHLPRLITACLVLTLLVWITGCLHEDGLADAADGFGGGTNREKILLILRDSRIGSYGGIALVLSLPLEQVSHYLIAAHVLCRWTTLPLSYSLPAARTLDASESSGQGARIALLTSNPALLTGSLLSVGIVAVLLRRAAVPALMCAILMTLATGWYYKRRIGGVTGDCFGATNQLTEIGIYLCGVWIR
jgi:adenosylcobinamide-GDP ribazoletransferase